MLQHRAPIRNCACLALAIALSWLAAPHARAATPQQVNAALEKAKDWIYSQQKKDGTWETAPARQPPGAPGQGKLPYGHVTTGGQWGGLTAVATYALLSAGENPQDPKLIRAVEFLKKADLIGTYALGIRCQVWGLLPPSPETRSLLRKDADRLMSLIKTQGPARGFYDYIDSGPVGSGTNYSLSRSQYGVLGIWAAAEHGMEIPSGYWKMVEETWTKAQMSDGAWEYWVKGAVGGWSKPSIGRTAVGIATLYLTQDYLHGSEGLGCGGNLSVQPAILKGIGWIEKHIDSFASKTNVMPGDFPMFSLYSVERIGVASGYKYLGSIDWFKKGVDYLVQTQGTTGHWSGAYGDLPNTCMGILFLSRGRAPVAINKLQYEATAAEGEAAQATWNERPRDIANLARWMGRSSERLLNWQIISLRNPSDLYDAPILYISGKMPLTFTPEQETVLRRYIEEGGLILGHADCGNEAFAKSFRKLGAKLFPAYEFRQLPVNHAIYVNQQFNAAKWTQPIRAEGLSNGCRELMVLLPTGDPAKAWQTQATNAKESAFQFAANLYYYSIDKLPQPFKGETHRVVSDSAIAASKPLKVARLKYNGNWNPEPGGWRRLAAILHNKRSAELTTTEVELAPGALAEKAKGGVRVAHLTGTTSFRLTPEQRSEIKSFVEKGGTLIIDAAGGSAEFATAAEAELTALFPDQAAQLTNILPADHPALTGSDKLAVGYRNWSIRTHGNAGNTVRLKGIELTGRMAVFFSPDDLSVGLVGHNVDGIDGYNPATASPLMTRLLLYAAEK